MTQVSIVKELEESAGIGRTTAKNKIRDVKSAMGITATKYPDEVRAQILHYAVSGETPVPMPVDADSSFDEIRDSGYLHLNNAEANALAFAHDVAALKEKCTKGQGGSDFGKRANDYWGLSSSQASRLLKIGQNTNFPEFGKLLPKSISALEPLAELTHEQITEAVESGAVHPQMTAKESSAVVKPDVVEDAEIIPAREGNEYQIVDGEAVEVGAKPIKDRVLNEKEAEISGMNGTMNDVIKLDMLFKTDIAADKQAKSLIACGEFFHNKWAQPYVYPPKLGDVEVVISAAENLIDKLTRFVETYREMK